LYIVPTPVGNLGDMTPRAIETLRRVSLILCEDTRTSAPLLRNFEISTPTASYHKFNEHATTENIVGRIEAGEDIALISDAGTPGISDPGFLLSRECRRRGVEVETLPGATAFVPALVNSGLPCARFSFEGFLPPKKGRETAMKRIAEDDRTTVVYESPLRLLKTLEQLAAFCGADRPMSVSREISKLHETTVRGTAAELIAHFSQNQPRGEIVIIIGGKENSGRASHRNKFKPED
ncbi:MAG: 16S rRNA (cytidine(1402)-2'-O)-methyltransferase, partial [Paramuribaculum sp.]|nr:16S rRNA (cytidine(1402)-2'-O)-methyltransferase [Paramuribaculum sp.]